MVSIVIGNLGDYGLGSAEAGQGFYRGGALVFCS